MEDIRLLEEELAYLMGDIRENLGLDFSCRIDKFRKYFSGESEKYCVKFYRVFNHYFVCYKNIDEYFLHRRKQENLLMEVN